MSSKEAAADRIKVLQRILQPSKVNISAPVLSNQIIYIQEPPNGLESIWRDLFTVEAINFLINLVEKFDGEIDSLYSERLKRKLLYETSSELPQFKISITHDWKVSSVPHCLQNRHLDLGDVSPSNSRHYFLALQADVQGIQVDFDDGHCPTWRNQLLGWHNVYQTVHGKIAEIPPISECPVLMLRPRAWNMIDHNIMVHGKEIPGSIVDFAVLSFHCAQRLSQCNRGPFFYLSKLEVALEAKLWNDIFVWTQERLGIPQGTFKACVLIENILSTFELDQILYALRHHSLGLNCGIWDYSASIICKFGGRPNFILPDRNKYVNMDKHFLNSYMKLVIESCHKRGAFATGGMAAKLLNNNPAVLEEICQAKLKEIHMGADGFMVYDLDLVPHMNELWSRHCYDNKHTSGKQSKLNIGVADLLQMPAGGVTLYGLRHNIVVAILFIFHWFKGEGHFLYEGSVEDSATAEISRSQVWQWIRHKVSLEDDGTLINKQTVENITKDFIVKTAALKSKEDINMIEEAANIFLEIVCSRTFPDFMTTYLNDTRALKFFHNKNMSES